MRNDLYYSILKYRHGLILGETLNAGILFYDPNLSRFFFELGDLKRISTAYSEVNVNFLNRFIKTLKNNITKSNGSQLFQTKVENLQDYISRELLFSDAAGLTFDPVERLPISNKIAISETINHLKQLFLVDLNVSVPNKRKRNEGYIISEVFNLLKNKSTNAFNKIELDKKVITPLIEFTFDFCWKSEINHFAKALAFDFKNNVHIQNKALQIYGALEQFDSSLISQLGSYKVDFLVSKPSDKTHFKEFDKALKIIESAKTPSNFSFEDEWNQYVNQIIEKAEELETN